MKNDLMQQKLEKLQKQKERGVDPISLAKRSILQWKLISSLANAALGWIAFSAVLFWLDDTASFWTASGILFTVIGLFIVADVFGIAMFFTHKIYLSFYISKNKTIPTFKKIKKASWGITLIWLALMLFFAQYSFDLMYESINSLFDF